MDAAARTLFHSLQRFKKLPDFIQLWPGHGAGSACGKALGAVPQTTLGYERRFNWAFKMADEQAFVDKVLAGQPDPPRYFAEMKRLNKLGPRLLSEIPAPQNLSGRSARQPADRQGAASSIPDRSPSLPPGTCPAPSTSH